MRRMLAASSLAAAIALAPAPAAAIKKTPYPEVRIAVPDEVKAEPALEAMRKQLVDAVARRNVGLLYELVGPTFFWHSNGEPSEQFDKNRDALHNFKVAFGFREFGHSSDSQKPENQLWEELEAATSGAPALYPMEGNPGVLCEPANAEPVDGAAMDRAIEQIEVEDEDSEWVYSVAEITLTENPGGGGVVEKVSNLAMPIAATNPPTKRLGNNPIPTHFQLLLPSGKTGWVDVQDVQPLALNKLCYGKGPGGAWKIVGYEQNN
jgi:hypothetical protein